MHEFRVLSTLARNASLSQGQPEGRTSGSCAELAGYQLVVPTVLLPGALARARGHKLAFGGTWWRMGVVGQPEIVWEAVKESPTLTIDPYLRPRTLFGPT
jgi:hypothetical protein